MVFAAAQIGEVVLPPLIEPAAGDAGFGGVNVGDDHLRHLVEAPVCGIGEFRKAQRIEAADCGE